MSTHSTKALILLGRLLKWTLPPIIIWYMVTTEKLDLVKAVRVCGDSWLFAAVTVVFFIVNTTLVTARWKLCLKAQGIDETFFRVFEYNVIGMFFNIFMPGSLGGDFVKCYLVAQDNPNARARSVATVLIDRIHGLFVVLLMGTIALMANPVTGTSAELTYLLMVTGALLAGVTLFFAFALTLDEKHPLVSRVLGYLPFSHVFTELYGAFATFRKSPAILLMTLPLSVLIITNSVVCFIILGRAIGETSSVLSYFATVPVGFMAVTLPISPAGLGVGQGAYYTLFKWQGMTPAAGAEAFSLFQIVTFICGLPGFFFYLTMKNRVDRACRDASIDIEEAPCHDGPGAAGDSKPDAESLCGSACHD